MLLVCSLICIPTIGGFIGLFLTADLENDWKRVVAITLIAIVVGTGFGWMFKTHEEAQDKKWNNGYCDNCNTKWTLVSVDHKNKYYTCENCGKIIEIQP
jgi:hypothetical protein